jgi:hypothetical protein
MSWPNQADASWKVMSSSPSWALRYSGSAVLEFAPKVLY